MVTRKKGSRRLKEIDIGLGPREAFELEDRRRIEAGEAKVGEVPVIDVTEEIKRIGRLARDGEGYADLRQIAAICAALLPALMDERVAREPDPKPKPAEPTPFYVDSVRPGDIVRHMSTGVRHEVDSLRDSGVEVHFADGGWTTYDNIGPGRCFERFSRRSEAELADQTKRLTGKLEEKDKIRELTKRKIMLGQARHSFGVASNLLARPKPKLDLERVLEELMTVMDRVLFVLEEGA